MFAFVLLFACAWVYLKYGNPPVATADKPFPFEADIVHVPLGARIDRQMQQPPFGVSEDVYETGAMAYKLQCASCHGVPGKDVAFAKNMYPVAPAALEEAQSRRRRRRQRRRARRDLLEDQERHPPHRHALLQRRPHRRPDVGRRAAAQARQRAAPRPRHRHAQSPVAPLQSRRPKSP